MSTYRLTDDDRKKVEAAWLAVDLSEIVAAVEAIVAPIAAQRDADRAALAAFRADVETLRAIGADSYHGCVAAKALAALLAKHAEADA